MTTNSCPNRKLSPLVLTARTESSLDMVLWCRTGSAEVTVSRRTVRLDAGHAILVSAGTQHAVQSAPDSVIVPIALTARTPDPRPADRGWTVRNVPHAAHALFLAAHVDCFNRVTVSPAARYALHERVREVFAHPGTMPPTDALRPPPARSAWLGRDQTGPVMLWCAHGNATVTFAEDDHPLRDVRLAAGQAVVVPGGTVHRTRTGPGGAVLPMLLGPGHPSVVDVELHHLPTRLRAEAAWWMVGWISDLAPIGRTWGDEHLPFTAAATDLVLSWPPTGTPAWRVQRIKRALHADPGHRATMDEWAARFGVTPQSVRQAFAAHAEHTFAEWRQEVRMLHASSLLDEGHQAKWVSHRLGFADVSAFSRAFRRHTGTSVRDYQADGRANALLHPGTRR